MKVIKIFLISILCLLVIMNVILVFKTIFHPKEIPGIFGYKPLIVLSGSMKPTFNYGDLIIIKEVDKSTLKKGDIISFRNNTKHTTTHRIYGVSDIDNDCFETKGDANNSKDLGIVCNKDIEGKYLTKVVGLGTVILFIQKPIGFIILMSFIIMICIYIYLSDPKSKKVKK